jgi:hypothetical protein
MTDLMTLAQGADLAPLGTIDDTEYVSLSVVLARHDGAVRVVCLASDWPSTLQARLIQAGEVIAFQQQQIEALAARAAAGEDASEALAKLGPVAAAMSAELREIKQQQITTAPQAARALPTPGGPMVCQECGASFASPRALTTHRNRKHRGAPAQRRELYQCGVCHQEKPLGAYYTQIDGETGRPVRIRTTCRACTGQASKRRELAARVEGELDCPECLAEGALPFKPLFNRRDLNQHRRYAHGVIGVKTRQPATIRPADDAAPGWRCQECKVDAMPDRHYDEFCVDCASTPTELAA